jgi:hypothetical protein
MVDDEVVVSKERKADATFCYFDQILGMSSPRSNSINLDLLNLPCLDPAGMGACFTEVEVWATIKGLPPDKSPRSDGFTTRFLQLSWELIRSDIMEALDAFWHLDMCDLHATNDALLVLLPKSPEATTIRDYRPISLIHLIGKLISKILADRLASWLNSLILGSQSTFIKGRTIHDSFKFVQASARQLFVRRKPTILFKANITKAFNTVAWSFLLEVLKHLGFTTTWINWVAKLLCTAITKVLLNGTPGDRIWHGRGCVKEIRYLLCCSSW